MNPLRKFEPKLNFTFSSPRNHKYSYKNLQWHKFRIIVLSFQHTCFQHSFQHVSTRNYVKFCKPFRLDNFYEKSNIKFFCCIETIFANVYSYTVVVRDVQTETDCFRTAVRSWSQDRIGQKKYKSRTGSGLDQSSGIRSADSSSRQPVHVFRASSLRTHVQNSKNLET